MRWDLIEHILNPKPTLADVERGLREVLRGDPIKAEKAVGILYGKVFRNKEIRYDAAGGRWLPLKEWS